MKKTVSLSDVLELGVTERIRFVEDVWDSIAQVPQAISLSPAEKRLLDQRLADFHDNPKAGSPWAEVKKRLHSR